MTAELEGVLIRHLGTQVAGLRRLAGGASHETWAFDSGDRPMVVRREVDGGLLASDVRGEFDLLASLHAQGLPVPEPVLCVTDEPRAFMVIGRVDGTDLPKSLARERCAEIRAGTPALTTEEAGLLTADVAGEWQIDEGEIRREFTFKTFNAAFGLATRIEIGRASCRERV